MTQQDEGWPLGLQPLNARIELARSGNNSGSVSFNTLVTTASPSSSTDFSSSGFDTESTGSFFPDKSTTLGSLMGVSSIVELSRRSLRGSKTELFNIKKENKKFNFISRLFCISSRSSRTHEAENHNNNAPVPSLGQYLAVERKASNENRRIQHQNPFIYGPEDDLALAETNNIAETNSLFVNGNIAPPHIQIQTQSINNPRQNNGFSSFAEIFSCICGQHALG